MIFLGAGASAPFGPKPYSWIETEVWDLLRRHNVEEICLIARKKIESDKLVFDFEAILTIFEFIRDIPRGILESGPILSWLKRDNIIEDFTGVHDKADEVVNDLKKLLYENCSNPDMKKANKIYDRFFEILKGTEQMSYCIDHDIFTTNYDIIIEKYHWDREKPDNFPRLKTGFEPSRDPYLHEFQPKSSYGNIIYDASIRNLRRLFKLHGSIDQKIEQYVAYKYPPGFRHEIQLAKDMMIFPVAEKYITQFPYYDLYNYFRNAPWTVGTQKETCIVIGFSFRDIPITNAFLGHIIKNERNKRGSKIILIDKDTKSVIKNLKIQLPKDDFEKISKTIDPIDGEFGSSSVFKNLEESLVPIDKNTFSIT